LELEHRLARLCIEVVHGAGGNGEAGRRGATPTGSICFDQHDDMRVPFCLIFEVQERSLAGRRVVAVPKVQRVGWRRAGVVMRLEAACDVLVCFVEPAA